MGPANKLLLQVDGVPLVRHVTSAIVAHPFAEVVVVTGHDAPAVEAALDGLVVKCVHNALFAEGQMTSVRTGLAALERPCVGVMVCLSDQPALTTDDLETLEGAFFEAASKEPPRVLVPTFGGLRGNPIILASASLEAILARGANFGCRQFVANNAELVTTFEMPNDHVLFDVDRPEDYEALSGLSVTAATR
jgi:molybdenum cofactor cytidylyltransferase